MYIFDNSRTNKTIHICACYKNSNKWTDIEMQTLDNGMTTSKQQDIH